MAERPQILICSCEGTMPLDAEAVRRGCRGSVLTADHLCRTEIEKFRAAAAEGGPLIVGCTQEAPLFTEVTVEQKDPAPLIFVNVRETAGWSSDAAKAGPKMAALIAAAAEPVPDFPLVSLSSEGVTLVYGHDERAIEAARLLAEHLDVTVLISKPKALEPPRVTEFPVVQGTIRSAKGHLGAFELVVDDYAAPAPSSRGVLTFGMPRNGAVSRCDLIIDLSGGAPLFPAHDLRDGYLRADPEDAAAVLRAVLKARDLTGTFDKPRYIEFTQELCAHSRSRIVGCRRCLDLCPTGAITPAGNHVSIDPNVCAGCGQCAAVCPTGAAAYALPPADTLLRKLRALLTTYAQAGGTRAIVLLHDEPHGSPLIEFAGAAWRRPAGERAAAGRERGDAGRARGGCRRVRLWGIRTALPPARQAAPRCGGAHQDDRARRPDPRRTWLRHGPRCHGRDRRSLRARRHIAHDRTERRRARPAAFTAVGAKRDVLRLALRELHHAAPAPVDVVPLPEGAPFGTLLLNTEGCTLCLSCVSACPTGALSDEQDRPLLRFAEDACVQCGLCKATCPEKVISLRPQLDFRASTAPARVLKRRSRSAASDAASRSASSRVSSASPPSSKASTGCSRIRRSAST